MAVSNSNSHHRCLQNDLVTKKMTTVDLLRHLIISCEIEWPGSISMSPTATHRDSTFKIPFRPSSSMGNTLYKTKSRSSLLNDRNATCSCSPSACLSIPLSMSLSCNSTAFSFFHLFTRKCTIPAVTMIMKTPIVENVPTTMPFLQLYSRCFRNKKSAFSALPFKVQLNVLF